MEGTQTARRVSVIRKVGWLSVASMLALALLAPAARAEPGNQTNVSWDQAQQSCTGGPNGDIVAGPGQVAWLFVHTQVAGPGTITANFVSAGQQTAQSYIQGNLKYLIWTGFDTLSNFSDNIAGGVLTLSHVCAGQTTTTTTTTTTTPVTTTTTTTTTSTTTTTTTTTPVTTTTTTTTTTTPVTTTTTTQATTTQATTTQATTTQATTTQATTTQATTTQATTTSFTSSVLAETGEPTVTTPPTDSIRGPSGPSGDSWRLILLAMAGLLAAVLVLTPAKVPARR